MHDRLPLKEMCVIKVKWSLSLISFSITARVVQILKFSIRKSCIDLWCVFIRNLLMFSPLFRHFKSIKIRTTIFRDFRFYKGAMVSRLSISEPSWLKSLVRCSLAKRQCGLICRCRSVAGKLLHTFGPATEKLLSPSRVLVSGTVRTLASGVSDKTCGPRGCRWVGLNSLSSIYSASPLDVAYCLA